MNTGNVLKALVWQGNRPETFIDETVHAGGDITMYRWNLWKNSTTLATPFQTSGCLRSNLVEFLPRIPFLSLLEEV